MSGIIEKLLILILLILLAENAEYREYRYGHVTFIFKKKKI